MKYLILTLGIPGSGKTHWVNKNGLDKYTISPDKLRRLYFSPTYNINGVMIQDLTHEDIVWRHMLNIIEDRMTRGEFIVVDATHYRYELINVYKRLVDRYNYKTFLIDLRKPLSQCINNNFTRKYQLDETDKFVPEEQIKSMFQVIENIEVPSWVEIIKPEEFRKKLDLLQDFSKYNKINIIGDIHGNYDSLTRIIKKMEIDFENRDELTIFLGDYFDRGRSIIEIYNLLKQYISYDNVKFLMGNHEMNLYRYSDFFMDRDIENIYNSITLEQNMETFKVFKENNISPKELNKFIKNLDDILFFKFKDKYIFVNHGGFPNIPSPLVRSIDYWRGIGEYDDMKKVAQTWVNKTPKNYIEIHGHRDNDVVGPEIIKNRFYVLNGASFKDDKIRGMNITENSVGHFHVKINDYKLKKN